MARHVALAVLLLAASVAPASAKGKPRKKAAADPPPAATVEIDPADLVDVTAARPRLRVLTDGKQHYVAVIEFARGDDDRMTFYSSDGKAFYRQRISGSGMSGKTAWNQTFWEPRYTSGYQKSLDFRDGKYAVQCDERLTPLTPLADADATALLDGATFYKARFKRSAYALARDDKGTYYYVDRAAEPAGNKSFLLYVGPKGNLALTKLVNVVSDSVGDIFATKKGELRLVLDKGDARWIKGKKEIPLTHVPIEDNVPLIFNELGVYAGVPLGTPCDDL